MRMSTGYIIRNMYRGKQNMLMLHTNQIIIYIVYSRRCYFFRILSASVVFVTTLRDQSFVLYAPGRSEQPQQI